MTVATVAAVVGTAAGGLSIYKGLTGGKGQQGGSGSSSTYVPTGLGGADTSWQNSNTALQQYIAQMSGMSPDIMAAYNKMKGIDTSGLVKAGQVAGGADQTAANLANSNMGSMVNLAAGQNALGNWTNDQGMKLWETALDPQKALQAQLQQQVQDSSRQNASAAGLGTSGAGVGTEDKAMSDFFINWQNQQLGRQIAGMGGLTQALGTGMKFQDNVGADLAAAQGYAGAVPGYEMAAGTDPMNAMMMAYGLPITAANQAGGSMQQNALNPYLAQMQQMIPYMNSGQGATGQLFNQQQTGLYNTLMGAQNMVNPSNWAALSSAFQGPQQSYSSTNSNATGYDPTQADYNPFIPMMGGG